MTARQVGSSAASVGVACPAGVLHASHMRTAQLPWAGRALADLIQVQGLVGILCDGQAPAARSTKAQSAQSILSPTGWRLVHGEVDHVSALGFHRIT